MEKSLQNSSFIEGIMIDFKEPSSNDLESLTSWLNSSEYRRFSRKVTPRTKEETQKWYESIDEFLGSNHFLKVKEIAKYMRFMLVRIFSNPEDSARAYNQMHHRYSRKENLRIWWGLSTSKFSKPNIRFNSSHITRTHRA